MSIIKYNKYNKDYIEDKDNNGICAHNIDMNCSTNDRFATTAILDLILNCSP